MQKLDQIVKILKKLITERFTGSFTINFYKGGITTCNETKTHFVD